MNLVLWKLVLLRRNCTILCPKNHWNNSNKIVERDTKQTLEALQLFHQTIIWNVWCYTHALHSIKKKNANFSFLLRGHTTRQPNFIPSKLPFSFCPHVWIMLTRTIVVDWLHVCYEFIFKVFSWLLLLLSRLMTK